MVGEVLYGAGAIALYRASRIAYQVDDLELRPWKTFELRRSKNQVDGAVRAHGTSPDRIFHCGYVPHIVAPRTTVLVRDDSAGSAFSYNRRCEAQNTCRTML